MQKETLTHHNKSPFFHFKRHTEILDRVSEIFAFNEGLHSETKLLLDASVGWKLGGGGDIFQKCWAQCYYHFVGSFPPTLNPTDTEKSKKAMLMHQLEPKETQLLLLCSSWMVFLYHSKSSTIKARLPAFNGILNLYRKPRRTLLHYKISPVIGHIDHFLTFEGANPW